MSNSNQPVANGSEELSELSLDTGDPCPWNTTTLEGSIDGELVNCSNSTAANEPNPFYFYEVEQLTFLGILFLVIVTGNIAVLGATYLARQQRKSRMNYFIMHLALADLAVGILNVLTDIIWKITVTWHLGNAGCKIVKYIQTVVIYSSNYVLVALSIDRYDAITHPLKFSGSWRRARILIGMAWGLSFLFASPALFIFQETKSVPGGTDVTQCWAELELSEWKAYITIVFTILFLIPAIIIAVCYTVMVHTIWTQPRMLTNPKSHSNGILKKSKSVRHIGGTRLAADDDDSRRVSSRGLIPKAKIKSVKMTFVIVFVFILCSSPYFVFSLLQVYGFMPRTKAVFAIATFFQSLSPLNSAANPIIYCLFSSHFCRNFRKIKVIDWMAEKFCPMIGRASPRNSILRRKFGKPLNNNQCGIGRSRSPSEFTSMSASMKRSTHSTSPALLRQVDSTSFFNREVHFHPRDFQQTPNTIRHFKSSPTAAAFPKAGLPPRHKTSPSPSLTEVESFEMTESEGLVVYADRNHCNGGVGRTETRSWKDFKRTETVDLHYC